MPNEMVERLNFEKHWNSQPYYAALPEGHPAKAICWQAWWRQCNDNMTVLEWNRDCVKACDYENDQGS